MHMLSQGAIGEISTKGGCLILEIQPQSKLLKQWKGYFKMAILQKTSKEARKQLQNVVRLCKGYSRFSLQNSS